MKIFWIENWAASTYSDCPLCPQLTHVSYIGKLHTTIELQLRWWRRAIPKKMSIMAYCTGSSWINEWLQQFGQQSYRTYKAKQLEQANVKNSRCKLVSLLPDALSSFEMILSGISFTCKIKCIFILRQCDVKTIKAFSYAA